MMYRRHHHSHSHSHNHSHGNMSSYNCGGDNLLQTSTFLFLKLLNFLILLEINI